MYSISISETSFNFIIFLFYKVQQKQIDPLDSLTNDFQSLRIKNLRTHALGA